MREKIKHQRILESLAKQGFTVYEGKKVTFAEAEQLRIESEKTSAELKGEKKLLILNEIENMLGAWSINEHRLTTFVEAAKKCVFLNVFEDMLDDKALTPKQDYIVHELKRNLEFLASSEEGATTLLLPSEAEKLIAGVIVSFYDRPEYLASIRELIAEDEKKTVMLMRIYSGRVTAKEIKELIAEAEKILVDEEYELLHKQHENLSDQEDNCIIGDDGICRDYLE